VKELQKEEGITMDDTASRQMIQTSFITMQVIIFASFLVGLFTMNNAKDTIYSDLYLNPSNSIGPGMMIYFQVVIVVNILLIILLWRYQHSWNWKIVKPIMLILSIMALPFSFLILLYALIIEKPDLKFFAGWSQTYGDVHLLSIGISLMIVVCVLLYALLLYVTGVTRLFENEYVDHRVVLDVVSPMPVGEEGYIFRGTVEVHYDLEGELYLITTNISYYRNAGRLTETAVDGTLLLDGTPICESTNGDGLLSSKEFRCRVTQDELLNQTIDTLTLQFTDGTTITNEFTAIRTEYDDIYIHSLFFPSTE
jgi:hypothetical protein